MHDLTQDGHNGDDADDISIEDMLDHIRTILVESAHARCLFTTKLRGLDVCMLYLSRAYHQKAAAALKAASLPLAAPQGNGLGRDGTGLAYCDRSTLATPMSARGV